MNVTVINQKINDLLTPIGLTRRRATYIFSAVIVIIVCIILYGTFFTAPQRSADLGIFSVDDDLASKGNVAKSLEYKGFIKSPLAFRIAYAEMMIFSPEHIKFPNP